MKFLLLLAAIPLMAQTHYVSTNYSGDLYGKPDTRQYTWGMTDSDKRPMTFHPPDGKIVVIDSIKGTVNAFISMPGPTIDANYTKTASGLFGLQSTADPASKDCDGCAGNTPIYVQFTVTDKVPANIVFNYDFKDGFKLEADNVLTQVMASFLNEAGVLHVEASYTIGFHYEDAHPLVGTQWDHFCVAGSMLVPCDGTKWVTTWSNFYVGNIKW